MDWLGTGPCAGIANVGWLIGAICGGAIDIAVIVAIAHAPRLREHGGPAPPAIGVSGRALPWVPAALVGAIWLIGLCYAGRDMLFCYASYSAVSAGLVIALLMAVLFPMAASQIARRSIW
jgi:hypothetical protein